ncbi:hypothetical protein FE257_006858 [Aspergillus nanangensis]|uniref:Uncharacterized protein n=1 Tax=Aspergillus nanangensis TaxID=2582783 RepID=A0AAD4C9Y4_ASPNN|nr:hypothetical protein FE257_006858 [Aspergillus nanangensis]
MVDFTFLPNVIPRCLKELPQVPPMCPLRTGDLQAIQIVTEHGRGLGRSVPEISQVHNLASGLSDIVVILERPREEKSHNPDQSFENFVDACDTLKAVDELLRFSSRGARNISTVTVINAFAFQYAKEKNDIEASLNCEEVLARFLLEKKPQVIIHCLNPCYQSPWMARFNFSGRGYRIRTEVVRISDFHEAIMIPSFHPSHAINYLKHRLELRVLLMYHFALAFRSLSSEVAVPCCASRVLDMCLYSGERKEQRAILSNSELASCISDKIHESYLPCKKDIVPLSQQGFESESVTEKINRESDTFSLLSFWLTYLLRKPHKFELYGIAAVLSLLRRANDNFNPIYSRVSLALVQQNIEQEHWFWQPENTTVAELEKSFCRAAIHDNLGVSDIIDVTRTACDSVSKIRHLMENGRNITFKSVEMYRHYRAVYTQISCMSKYLGKAQELSISQALRMEALSKRCWVTLEALYETRGSEEELPYIEVFMHVNRLMEYLVTLRMELEIAHE